MGVYLLLKFGQEDHLKFFQKHGLIYCNPVKYFADLEDNNTRGDKLEAAISFQYEPECLVELKPLDKPEMNWIKLPSKDLSIIKYSKSPLGNLFCMSALNVPVIETPTIYEINNQFNATYTHYLLIYDTDTFLQRLKAGLNKLPFEFQCRLVEYLNLKKYTGEKDVFKKDLSYSWQEEFRVYLDIEKTETFSFSIGSLEDISSIYALSETPAFMIKGTMQ
jgi:hypothetical protein